MLANQKVCTSRNKRYGRPGDTFQAFGADFELLAVTRTTLLDVSRHFFQQEGCSSPEEFEEIWTELHPRRGFVPAQAVYLHRFCRKK